MAKKRYDLGQTMADAASNIEEAKQATETTAQLIPEPEEIPVVENIPVEIVVEEPIIFEEKKDDTPLIASPTTNKRKTKSKKNPVIETSGDEKMNFRSVELDDETLWRLDAVKSKLNRARNPSEPLVSQKSLINTALIFFLDKNYPETKEAYKIINNLL